MIRRKRPKAPPSYVNSVLRRNQESEIDQWRKALIESTRQGTRTKRARYRLGLHIKHKSEPHFITELLDCFDHKCPFCEVKLDEDRTEVFFYRPPYDALQDQNDLPDEHYYCWLIWEWSNLFPACESCMMSRGTVFPVGKVRVNLGVRRDDFLSKEEPLLLDPCNNDPDNDPDKHLEFHEDGKVTAKPGSKHGEKTIEILSLNRERLQADRRAEAQVLRRAWEEELQKASVPLTGVSEILQAVNQALKAYCLDDQPFAEMKSQLLGRWTEGFGKKDKEALSPGGSLEGKPQKKIGSDEEMPPSGKRPLRIFLCHASGDKPVVRDLYRRLVADGFAAWLDEEKLMPGQDWDLEIRKAVRSSNTVVVCLSNGSITKEGYVQKEIRLALDIADEKPEGTIFLIPVRLEECDVPDRLSKWHWVNFFEEQGYERLVRALRTHAQIKGLLGSRNDPAAGTES